jgi:single-strand DNA-binding protein
MASVNKVILIGAVEGPPEVRPLRDGNVCTLRLVTTATWMDKRTGAQNTQAEHHRVVLYRQLADVAQRYLEPGAEVYIEGTLRNRSWQDDQGRTRYITEIEANSMTMLGARSQAPSLGRIPSPPPRATISTPTPQREKDPWEDAPVAEDPFPW